MNEPFCVPRVVTGFANAPTGVSLPDAHWEVDTATQEMRFQVRTPGTIAPFTRRTILLVTDKPRTVSFAIGGVAWRLDPPTGQNDCHYWGDDRPGRCPAAAACPYRANIVLAHTGLAPAGAPVPIPLMPVPVERVNRNLFLLDSRPTIHPIPKPDLAPIQGITTLPPVAVAQASNSPVGFHATQLRSALLANQPRKTFLRSDLLVAAVDLPGVREAVHTDLLTSLDLEETFAPVQHGSTNVVSQTLLLTTKPSDELNRPSDLWQPYYSTVVSVDPIARWLQSVISERLEQLSLQANWLSGLAAEDRLAPSLASWDYYASDLSSDLGRTLVEVRRRLLLHPAGVTTAAWFDSLCQPVSGVISREKLKALLFDMVLDRVPGGFLAPPGINRFPGQLFDRWLWAEAGVGGIANSQTQLAAVLSTASRDSPIRIPTRRIAGRTLGPARLVLGARSLRGPFSGHGWVDMLNSFPNE